MTLPPSARKRLTSPLHSALSAELAVRHAHSLPINPRIWALHAEALAGSVGELAATCTEGDPTVDDYSTLERWLRLLRANRSRVFSHLLALQPFEPCDDEA